MSVSNTDTQHAFVPTPQAPTHPAPQEEADSLLIVAENPSTLPQKSSLELPEPIKKWQQWKNFIRSLPRALRTVLYIGFIVFLPFYIGVVPKLLLDVLKDKIEETEIWLGLRSPRKWIGRFHENFASHESDDLLTRWDGAAKGDIQDHALSVRPGTILFFKLRSELYKIYDGLIVFDIVYQDTQKSASWILRAKRNRSQYYRMTVTFPTEAKNDLILTGDIVSKKKSSVDRLYINNDQALMDPLRPGDKLKVSVLAEGCIFKCRIELIEKDPASKNKVNIFYGTKFATAVYAEQPCEEYGDIGFQGALSDVPSRYTNLEICTLDEKKLCPPFDPPTPVVH
jgi:hypothetical protein